MGRSPCPPHSVIDDLAGSLKRRAWVSDCNGLSGSSIQLGDPPHHVSLLILARGKRCWFLIAPAGLDELSSAAARLVPPFSLNKAAHKDGVLKLISSFLTNALYVLHNNIKPDSETTASYIKEPSLTS